MRSVSFLCRASKECQLFKILAHWLCGSSPENNAIAAQDFLGQDSTLAADHGSGFDAGVIADADLASHDDVVFDGDAAREAGLGGDDYVLSDLAVVANVDEVVDLRALADS